MFKYGIAEWYLFEVIQEIADSVKHIHMACSDTVSAYSTQNGWFSTQYMACITAAGNLSSQFVQ